MSQMFGSGVYNYVFIDRNSTDLLRYKLRSGPQTDGASVYLADLLVLLSQEKFAP